MFREKTMTRAWQAFGLIACGCVTAFAAADDTSTLGPEYFSALPGVSFPSKAIGTTGRGATVSGIFGHEFSPHILAELNVQSSTFETGAHGGTDFYQNGATLDVAWQLRDRRESLFTPFVLAGVGAVYDDYYPETRDGVAPVIDAGLGVVTAPLLRNGIRLRLDARYVRDMHEGGHPERRLIAGIDIPLGRVEHHVEFLKSPPEIIREVIREPAAAAAIAPAPIRDSDGDGIADEYDRCPDTPRGLRVDVSGCVVTHQSIDLEGVNFNFNDAHLTPQAERILDEVAKAYRGQLTMRTEIAGHTDSIGDVEANLKLSQRRAETVREYLISRGARSEQIIARGYGKSRLRINPERSEADAERNRRVELSILSP
jgi:OOP family OmpA-OmpF porin